MAKKKTTDTLIETYTHSDLKRKNIPTEQMQPFVTDSIAKSIPVSYEKRNPDLDPQLIWRGKYDGDVDLTVEARPLYIQEKINPKAIIENLRKSTKEKQNEETGQILMFDDTWGIGTEADKMAFYQHDENWTNRMILGDSLQVMASLANKEGLRGKVQCIYMDPPYGIKFNSNFQWSTTTRTVKDGNTDSMTREPEMIKAFRDTWKDGVNSYLSYLRDRFIIARDLLSESGSIFVQIGDENVHLIKSLMEEVFGKDNFRSLIAITKVAGGLAAESFLPARLDYIVWFCKNRESVKYRKLFEKQTEDSLYTSYVLDGEIKSLTEGESLPEGAKLFRSISLTKPGPGAKYPIVYKGKTYTSGNRWWGTTKESIEKLIRIGRVRVLGNTLRFIRYADDFNYKLLNNLWDGLAGAKDIIYVVQTNTEIVKRCILMTTDPSDLVLDPTCGSGTTAYVSEQWGRRWITIDTSRVALALARSRLMGAKFPYYLKRDSREGRIKEAELNSVPLSLEETYGSLRYGFVYKRAPHITMQGIANNKEIDLIYESHNQKIQSGLLNLNASLGTDYDEWDMPKKENKDWSKDVKTIYKKLVQEFRERQLEIDRSIQSKAEYEYLYDQPYFDKSVVRVTGPFTVESLSPHRILSVDANGNQIDPTSTEVGEDGKDFVAMILENLRKNGIQQTSKDGALLFTCVEEWPGNQICAIGKYLKGEQEKRAAILVGPEFGTLSRPGIMEAAREAVESGCDMLVACAFHFDAQSTEVVKLGKLAIMKVMMNTDLMMGNALKGKGNLFVAFGEPDIVVEEVDSDNIRVRVRGVDVFFPNTGEVRSDNEDGIACWFVDTDYDQESFFVRQAYFLGTKDPYDALKRTLKAEIDAEVWESVHRNVSRPFKKPASGQIAVKVINHLGDEVMKVLRV